MFFKSNAEHELVDAIQNAKQNNVSCILFNPGAFTHTSVALRDAILGVDIPMIEIHLSNIYGRESFREKSYFSDIALGIISGFGDKGYEAALKLAMEKNLGVIMDIRKVKKLIEMLENSSLNEIVIKEGEESVKLVKSAGSLQIPQTIAPSPQLVASPALEKETKEDITKTAETKVIDGKSINSPMVGTFFTALRILG